MGSDARLKIVYFSYLYDLYEGSLGSTLKAKKLLQGLRDLGDEVQEYWLNAKQYEDASGGPPKRSLRAWSKKRLSRYLHEVGELLKNLRYIWKEWQIVRSERPDLVISRHGGYTCSTAILAKLVGFPFVMEIDSPEAYENRRFYSDRYFQLPGLVELVERLNFRLAPKAFVQTNVLREYARKRGGFRDGELRVIPNAAEEFDYASLRREAERVRAELGFTEKDVVIGFVGSFHYWHGVDNLLQIMRRVLGSPMGGEVRFLLVGGGGAKEDEVRQFVKARASGNDVVMTGFVKPERVGAYLQAMDIVLAPYPPIEFFYYSPVKLFDYMAHGKAIVASRLGQIEEVLVHGRTGLLCDPGNPEEFVQAISRLVREPDLRRGLGEAVRQEFLQRHRWIDRARALHEFCVETVREHGWTEWEN